VVDNGTWNALSVETSGKKAVLGRATATTGLGPNYGGYFEANNAQGRGVAGFASGSSGQGVYGEATATGNVTNYGGYLTAAGAYGRGVSGYATNTGDYLNYGGYFEARGRDGRAVSGEATGSSGIGVYGYATNTGNFTNTGGHFLAAGSSGRGVFGKAMATGNVTNYGGWFEAWGDTGVGIYAQGGSSGYAAEFNGTTKTNVLEITGGADLSEQFQIGAQDAKSSPSPGMVVSIDPENPGELVVSNKAYDRRVAGIISGAGGVKPGMLMGQKGSKADGSHPVALTGRVYCYADASNDPIEPGDLLTTSDTPGHAMKVTDYAQTQGAILGKAMTGLNEEKGLILVLVALQ
jgi:hypothetical protein